MADNIDTGVFISRLPNNVRYKLVPNQYERKYDMLIMMDNVDGVSCHICNTFMDDKMNPVSDCYYCEEDKIFMHKSCLVAKHRINKNPAISNFVNKTTQGFHEDKLVNVKFIKPVEESIDL